ncbi:hypothetical protein [Actinomadura parmotrematis]|uniref:DUF4231 domain-containing protein n=1 Tax=Actinomadura parmotrematis TaxID=2864039 RepID=A0ABS7G393_9ACTN|nr:hypothetical protein [Actinomadura parmotrematis]MBW8487191.1 hypothetical protein [Actinomadura parmotrematis]
MVSPVSRPFQVEYRPAVDLKDRYIDAENRMWNSILLVLALIGTTVLVANLAAEFLPGRGAIFLYSVVIVIYLTLMINRTWGMIERLVHDQEKLMSMYIASTQMRASSASAPDQPDEMGGPAGA